MLTSITNIHLVYASVYNVYSFALFKGSNLPPILQRARNHIINFVRNVGLDFFFFFFGTQTQMIHFEIRSNRAMTPPTHLSSFKLLVHVPHPI